MNAARTQVSNRVARAVKCATIPLILPASKRGMVGPAGVPPVNRRKGLACQNPLGIDIEDKRLFGRVSNRLSPIPLRSCR
jgi:hypothetical protein